MLHASVLPGRLVSLLIALKISNKILTPSQTPTPRPMISRCTDQVILLNVTILIMLNE